MFATWSTYRFRNPPIPGAEIFSPLPWIAMTRKYSQNPKPMSGMSQNVIRFKPGMKPRTMFRIVRPPKMTSEFAAFHLTSGSSLPTNRKMMPPIHVRT